MITKLLLSMPGGAEWIMVLLPALVVLLLLVIFRLPIMWYFGNIDLINESRKQTKLLEEIRDSLKKNEKMQSQDK